MLPFAAVIPMAATPAFTLPSAGLFVAHFTEARICRSPIFRRLPFTAAPWPVRAALSTNSEFGGLSCAHLRHRARASHPIAISSLRWAQPVMRLSINEKMA